MSLVENFTNFCLIFFQSLPEDIYMYYILLKAFSYAKHIFNRREEFSGCDGVSGVPAYKEESGN